MMASPAESLVLASGSPRRRELLQGLGLEFEVRPADIDETPFAGEVAGSYVLRLAEGKARAVARPGELVLAADTVVAIDGRLLGKPEDPADARRMLAELSGRAHQVLTGIALCDVDRALLLAQMEVTQVRFAVLDAAEIAWYVDSGEPLDKAGAYAIQGQGAIFVEAIEGSYSNVVGLPLALLYRLLRRMGWTASSLPALPSAEA